MLSLIVISIVWAFSFGLIGSQLGGLPPAWLAWIRLGMSALTFLPLLRPLPWRHVLWLFLTGAVQFGFMYLAYMTSFRYLQSHEVALYTVVTPLLIAGLHDLASRRFKAWTLLAALLAVAGAAVIQWQGVRVGAPVKGILLVQLSNLCFAAGQLGYRAVMARLPVPRTDRQVFFWLHFGGFAALTPIALPLLWSAAPPAPTPAQWAILLYLGLIASGIGFFLWNRGARQVSAAQLAILNNLKIPLGVLVSLLLFHETAGLRTLLAGLLLFAVAFWAGHQSGKTG